MSPGNFYDGAKQNGQNPTLKEYEHGVIVLYTGEGGAQEVAVFFRTHTDCQTFNQNMEDQSKSEAKNSTSTAKY